MKASITQVVGSITVMQSEEIISYINKYKIMFVSVVFSVFSNSYFIRIAYSCAVMCSKLVCITSYRMELDSTPLFLIRLVFLNAVWT